MSTATLSPAQCRMARAALRWTQKDLAEASGVARPTIYQFENGQTDPHPRTLRDLRETFDAHGVAFSGTTWTEATE